MATNLAGQQGLCPLLPESIWTKLHYDGSGANKNYAFGWVVNDYKEWLGEGDFSHDGCDETFTSQVIVSPTEDLCFAISTNEGDEEASSEVIDAVCVMLFRHYGINVD